MKDTPLNFGASLASWRQNQGMSQRELAKKCGISPAYVAALERNTSEPPPLRTCKVFAHALHIDPEEIWQRSFAARLKRWLEREDYAGIRESDLIDLVKKIDSISR